MNKHIASLFSSPVGYRSLLWLEGKRLADAGFLPGVQYTQTWMSDRIIFALAGTPEPQVTTITKTYTRKVNVNKGNPVIRIEGVALQKLFGEKFSTVEATFERGMIVIVGKDAVQPAEAREALAA